MAEGETSYGLPLLPAVAIAALGTGLVLAPLYLSGIQGGLFFELMWWVLTIGIAAIGLNLVLGQGGMFHLGSVGFMALGGTCSMIVTSFQWQLVFAWGPASTFFVGALLGIAVSALVAIGIGWPTLRLRGDYFAIATLGFGEIVRIVLNANPFESLNPNAHTKLVLLPSADLFGLPLTRGTFGEMALVMVLFVAVLVVALRTAHSPFGRLLRASRDDELGTMSLGKHVFHLRLKAFMMSAAFASLAGSLYVHHLGTFAPLDFALMLTIIILLTVILGGAGSTVGAVLGVVVIKVLVESPRWLVGWSIDRGWLTREEAAGIDIGGTNLLVFAILVILTMLLYPYGLLGEGSLFGSLAERARRRVFLALRALDPFSKRRGLRPAPAAGTPPPGSPPPGPPADPPPPEPRGGGG